MIKYFRFVQQKASGTGNVNLCTLASINGFLQLWEAVSTSLLLPAIKYHHKNAGFSLWHSLSLIVALLQSKKVCGLEVHLCLILAFLYLILCSSFHSFLCEL